MKQAKEKKNVLKINFKDPEFRTKYTSDKYKNSFDWYTYSNYYKDLSVNTFNDAWNHWCKYGINEKRLFFVKQHNPSGNNLFAKIRELQVNEKKNTSDNPKSILKSDKPNYDSIQLRKNDKEEEKKPEKKQEKKKPINNFFDENDLEDNKLIESTIRNTIRSKQEKEKVNRTINIDYEYTEEVRSKIKLFNIKNIILKNLYGDYGVQYFGWSGAFNNLIDYINDGEKDESLEFNTDNQYILDEWIEKLLIWGNVNDNSYVLNEIKKNNYNIISFLHNPPFINWYNNSYRSTIIDKIIYNNESTNKFLFEQIDKLDLKNNITYLYALSNSHKEYLYNKCPDYKHKIVSVLHPINYGDEEKKFDMTLFSQTKQILHIGWSMKNFEKFTDFYQPKEFNKTILIKKGFENEWHRISSRFDLSQVTILKELKSNEYAKLFTSSCIFVYFEDVVASNLILECIKFNTPIITNKIPSIIEYLGENYPLYYHSKDDLSSFKNPKFLMTQIELASNYLKKMDKTHIMTDNFNKKIYYDLRKLQINIDAYKLTWICPIRDITDIFSKIQNLYNNFISQNNNKQLILKIMIEETLYDHEDYDAFIKKLDMYEELVHNITYEIGNIEKLSLFLNESFTNCETKYITFIDINDEFDINFSDKNIEYLNEIKNCDISFSSYICHNSFYKETFMFKRDLMLFLSNFSNSLLSMTGIVYRTNIFEILMQFKDLSEPKYIFREFHRRAIENHLNLMCCSNEPLFKTLYI